MLTINQDRTAKAIAREAILIKVGLELCRYLAGSGLHRDVGTELHRSMDDFATARAQSDSGDKRRDNDHVLDLHSLLS
jgi:hypothetical protein